MKYFTPERFVSLQDGGTEAMQDWERAAQAYEKHVQALRAKFAKQLHQFFEFGSLHDAVLLAAWQEPRDVLQMLLQKDSDATHIIELSYRLAGPVHLDSAALPASLRSIKPTWLYDELDQDTNATWDPAAQAPQKRSRGKSTTRGRAAAPVFRHDILLSNGHEITLRFSRISLHCYPAVGVGNLPVGQEMAKARPRSA